jgi:hypothetical protein
MMKMAPLARALTDDGTFKLRPFRPRTLRTLAKTELEWEITTVKTLTVDDQKRIRIPDAKPRQVFAYANNGDGTLTLTLVKAEASEPFPRGSLLKYFTPEKNVEELALLSGCTLDQN